MEAPLENILMLTFHSCLNISTGLWIRCKHRDLGHLSVRKALPQDLNSYTPKSKRDYGNWTQIQCSYPFPLTITHLLDYTAKKGQDSVVTIICKTLTLIHLKQVLVMTCLKTQLVWRKQQHLMLGAATCTSSISSMWNSTGCSWDPLG